MNDRVQIDLRNNCSLRTELHRAWGKTFRGKPQILALIVPVMTGLIISGAFMCRSSTINDRFIFFSCIYAFWTGLFNCCQIVNGAVASGEWSYWVLAFRRSFLKYVTANTIVGLVIALLQILIFVFVVVVCNLLYANDGIMNIFLPLDDISHKFITDVLKLNLTFVAMFLMLFAYFTACVAGALIGAFISCVSKDVLGGLKFAVGYMVIAMVTSTAALQKETKRVPASAPLLLKYGTKAPTFMMPPAVRKLRYKKSAWNGADKASSCARKKSAQARIEYQKALDENATNTKLLEELWAKIQVAEKNQTRLEERFDDVKTQYDKLGDSAGVWPHFLEDVSLVIPVRYFYNIGRVFSFDVLQYKSGLNTSRDIFQCKLEYFRYFNIQELWEGWKQGKSECKNNFLLFFFSVIGIEFAASLLISGLFYGFGIFWITNKKEYYELR